METCLRRRGPGTISTSTTRAFGQLVAEEFHGGRPMRATGGAEALGNCPICGQSVLANAEAVRYRRRWCHVRCALAHQEP
jgi:hypothetical protein